MPSTPPTSPQRSQATGHHTERANRIMGSPEQRRTPAAPLAPSAAAVPPPSNQSREPVTFGGQTYHNLPPHLAALLAAVAPFPAAPQNRSRYRQPSIPFHTPIPISAFTSFAANSTFASTSAPAPTPISASTSASASALAVPPQHYRRRPATSLLAPAPVSFYYLLLVKHLYN